MTWKAYLRVIWPDDYQAYIEELNTILNNPMPGRCMMDDEQRCNERWCAVAVNKFSLHGWTKPRVNA